MNKTQSGQFNLLLQSRNNLDIVASGFGLLITLIIWIEVPGQRDIALVVLFACLLYLILRKKLRLPQFDVPTRRYRQLPKLISYITFLITFTIIVLINNAQIYHRPVIYFILIGFLAAIVSYQILSYDKKTKIWPLLIEICVLSALVRWGILYVFPSLVGSDSYFHAKMAQYIMDTGSIPPTELAGYYTYYPIFHLQIAIMGIIGSLGIKDTMFLSVSIPQVIIITLFIYIIGRQLAGARVGLMAALLSSVSTSIVARGSDLVPETLVGCLLLIIYFLLNKPSTTYTRFLLVFVSIICIVTHTLSTFITLTVVFSFFVAERIWMILEKHKIQKNVPMTYLLFLIVATIGYWLISYRSDGLTIFEWLVQPLIATLKSGTEFGAEDKVTYAAAYGTWTNVLFHLGYLLLLFLGIVGLLFSISSRRITFFMATFATLIILAFVYGIPAFGIDNFLPGRWFPFLEIFLAILASISILAIIDNICPNIFKPLLIFGIVGSITFLSISTPNVNKDSPFYSKERAVRNQLKTSETVALSTIDEIHQGVIQTDLLYASLAIRQGEINSKLEAFSNEYLEEIKHNEIAGSVIILRECLLSEPMIVYDPTTAGSTARVQITSDFFKRYKSEDYDLFYINSGGIMAYLAT